MPTLPPDIISLTYENDAGLLACHWRPDAPSAERSPVFEVLLTVALETDNCRFWLFDMQERAWHPPVFDKWFESLLSLQVVQVLGEPVFLTCVATEQNRVDIEGVATQVRLRARPARVLPLLFTAETAACEWLLYHQELEGR